MGLFRETNSALGRKDLVRGGGGGGDLNLHRDTFEYCLLSIFTCDTEKERGRADG